MLTQRSLQFLFTGLLLAVSSARADQASHLRKAEEFATLTQMDQRMSQSADLMLRSMLGPIEAQTNNNQALSEEAKQLVRNFLEDSKGVIMKGLEWASVKKEVVAMIADNLSERELDDLIAFYKTPSGKAAIEKSEIMMQQGNAIGQKRALDLQPELQKLTQEFMAKAQQMTSPKNSVKPLPKN